MLQKFSGLRLILKLTSFFFYKKGTFTDMNDKICDKIFDL